MRRRLLDFRRRSVRIARVLIKPITVRLVAYGQKANVAAIRTRAVAFLEDEHGRADEAAFTALSAADAHAEIVATRFEDDVALKKPTASQAGIAIVLAEVNERLVGDWLQELPVAKTCVAFATWTSAKDGMAWQLLIADGGRWSESRSPGT
jgi:hypothetical protein